MIDTRTESLLMVEIFMPLADVLFAGFEIGFPLRGINTLSVGGNIVALRSKERNKCGRG